MRAWAPKDKNRRSRRSKRQLKTRIAPPPPPPPAPAAPPTPNLHFEAAWTESWCHLRCYHEHRTVLEAAQCAMPHGCGWYLIGVENGEPRGLTDQEEQIMNRFRFGKR